MKAVFTVLFLCVGLLAGCRRQHYKTIHVTVPEMKGELCAELVRDALRGEEAILQEEVAIDLQARTVSVTYDSLLLARRNIEFAIADAGFSALQIETQPDGSVVTNRIPANEAALARLPAVCKPGSD